MKLDERTEYSKNCFISISPRENDILPIGINKKLVETDWNKSDVLVGSLGSERQLQDNLTRKYYYVPAKYIASENHPINHVAIFQSSTLFGNNSGIRYYGNVTKTSLLTRKEIDFPMRRNNGDEKYYAFMVDGWKTLTIPIDGRYESVNEPKFTNMFLLEHCTRSYELFSIRSAEQYVLFHVLYQIFGDALSAVNKQYECVRRFSGDRSIWIHDGYIDVLDGSGNRINEKALFIEDYCKQPKSILCKLTDMLI